MRVRPDLEIFTAAYESGKPQVVWTTFVADLETPVSVMLKLGADRADSILFESVEGGAVRGRYSIIGIKPDLIWRCRGNKAEINRNALVDREPFEPCPGGTLDSLRAVVAESRIDLPPELPPMAAGLVGYMSYDTVRLMEKLPDNNPDVLGLPDGIFLRPTIMAIFDNVEDTVTLVTPVWPDELSAGAAHVEAGHRLADTIDDLERSIPHRRARNGAGDAVLPEVVSNTSREQYHAMVERAKEYIFAGDVFQVVPSQRFSVPFTLPSFALYRALRRLNPSPFLFHLDF
ncbi:MAG: chorismate-binding protein, partial [Proteobacteria bacterium]|nr:chorismate-binding protein [Pseudomonadota bacterium]